MRMRFIFFLLLNSSILLLATEGDLHMIFEIMQADKNYEDILNKKAETLNKKGFNCNVTRMDDTLSLRCNEIHSSTFLAATIEKFKQHHIDYTLLNLNTSTTNDTRYKQIPLYIGYRAYTEKEYTKALSIFKSHYEEKQTLEHAKAYALVLFKLKKYQDALRVLTAYAREKTLTTLYKDISTAYLDSLLEKEAYSEAYHFIEQAKISPEQKKIFTSKVNYKKAISLNKEGKYTASNALISPSIPQEGEKQDLFLGNLMALSAKDLENKNFDRAASRLQPYADHSKEVSIFLKKIFYYRSIHQGYNSIETDPKKALAYFNDSCEQNISNACLEGKMYAYQRLGEHKKALALANTLYDETSQKKYLTILTSYQKNTSSDTETKHKTQALPASQSSSVQDHFDILMQYNNSKNYTACYTYAETLLKQTKDPGINRIGGWCAYHAKAYHTAKHFFDTIAIEKTVDDLYALALISYQLKDNASAYALLEELPVSNSDLNKIALLYNDIHHTREAKELLTAHPQYSDSYDSAIRVVNNANKQSNPLTQISAGLAYYHNNGESGKSYLDVTSLPIDIDYILQNGAYHLYADLDILSLRNGSTNNDSYKDFAFALIKDPYHLDNKKSFEGTIGIRNDLFSLALGITPTGLDIAPELTGKLYVQQQYGTWNIHASVEQQSIKESFLSYVGQTSYLNDEVFERGRALKRGATVGVSYSDTMTYTLDLFYYPKIYGNNIIDNSEAKAVATVTYHTTTTNYAFLDFGAVLLYDSYDSNSNLFTYGHGGYFSPQDFFLISTVVDIGDYINEDTYYKFQGALGYQSYTVEDTERFPILSPFASPVIEEGYDQSSITYKASLQVGYHINQHFDLLGGVSWEKVQEYQILKTGFSLSYHFNTQQRASLQRLKDAHQIEQIIP